ncbi:hypothetical protein DFR33_10477 [Bradymonas sediminis]|nr:hypothetical protein DFR33_10477 [Bradymonas sediminis]
MAAISKTTANRRMITHTLASSVDTQGGQLAGALNAVLFEGNPPDPLTMSAVIGAVIRVLQRDYAELNRLDQLVAKEKAQAEKKRVLRDQQIARVRQRVFSIRSLLEGSFGGEAIPAMGLGGRTPEGCDALITHGRNIQAQLEEGLSSYETLFGLERPNLGAMSAELGRDLDQLEAAVDAVRVEVRETEDAQAAHNRANEAWSRHYAPVAGILENLYRLAEMNAHADRLRPTSRRRAGLPEAADIEEGINVADMLAVSADIQAVESAISRAESR